MAVTWVRRAFVFITLFVPLVLAGTSAEASVCVNLNATAACLEEADGLPLRSRLPLILVHGWNREGIGAQPLKSTWSPLIAYISADAGLSTEYKTYYFSYYSNVATVAEIGRAMRDVVDLQSQTDPTGFGARRLAIVSHSMGGLVARYFLQLQLSHGQFAGRVAGDRLSILITLGTPHHGAMLANGPAMASSSGSLYAWLWDQYQFFAYPLLRPNWYEPNRTDLFWDNHDGLLDYTSYPSEQNPFLNALNGDTRFNSKIYAYAGSLAECVNVFEIYCAGSTLLRGLFGLFSDGVVPVGSAILVRAGTDRSSVFLARTFPDHNHTQIAEGNGDGRLFAALKVDLLAPLPSTPINIPNIAGTWRGDLSDTDGPGQMSWTLTQVGATVTGTVRFVQNLIWETTGTITGTLSGSSGNASLNFKVTYPAYNGGFRPDPNCLGSFSGTARVSVSTIEGTYAGSTCVHSFSDGRFLLRK